MSNLLNMGTKVLSRMIIPKISKANLVLTFKCNHKCVTCNIWKTHGRNLTKGVKGELTVEEIEKIVTRNKLIYLSLTGGEAFLREDISDIIQVCMKHVPMVTMTSNGSMPDKMVQTINQILPKAKGILDINISLDGNREQHDTFTGIEGSYERATESIERLLASQNGNLKLSIETLVSSHVEKGKAHVYQYAREMGLPLTYTIEQKAPFYDNEENVIKPTELPHLRLKFNPYSLFSYLYIRNAKRKHRVKCVAGQYTCSITPNGDVMPCLFLPTVLKNLKETDYVIGKLDYKEVVEKCQGCWTPCFPKGTRIVCIRKRKSNIGLPSYFTATKPIEEIKIGDQVLSFEELTSKKEFKEVTQTYRRKATELIKLTFSNGNTLTCTPEHPIFTAIKNKKTCGRWIEAQLLEIGDGCLQTDYSGITFRLENIARNKSPRIRKLVSERMKNNNPMFNQEFSEKRANTYRGKELTKEHKENIGEGSHKAWQTSEKLIALKATTLSSESAKEREKVQKDKNPNYALDKISNFYATVYNFEINKIEKKLLNLLDETCPGEFAYNGHRELGVTIGHRIPDFWNINGKKKAIELFGDFWHGEEHTGRDKETEENKMLEAYNKAGVNCLIIWEHELENIEKLKEKVLTFIYNPHIEPIFLVKKEKIHSKKEQDVFNIEVKDNNNYFACGILVHNCEAYPTIMFRPWRLL